MQAPYCASYESWELAKRNSGCGSWPGAHHVDEVAAQRSSPQHEASKDHSAWNLTGPHNQDSPPGLSAHLGKPRARVCFASPLCYYPPGL